MKIHELKYSGTNTYLIEGDAGSLLFDTGWAGTFGTFCAAMGEAHLRVQDIRYILISHFHPDHMGIAQSIADKGPVIAVADAQKGHIHDADDVFGKEKNREFEPIDEGRVRYVALSESREFLRELGIDGEIVHTPGHSDDSISLCLDDGSLFVGDLNPIYELKLHAGTEIGESWRKLLDRSPKRVYYGHAPSAVLYPVKPSGQAAPVDSDLYDTAARIMRYIDGGMSFEKIERKTGAARGFIEDVARMYLTHKNVGVQGILDRIEIKGR
ncbi:MAG: MBL fold metallo-hydrolase [Lachnospiraceae bacterium]|nr:MBL fold metallo-hydrolase [Lachnospiraceae bacterium]